MAPPFRVVELDILFGSGIDTYGCLLDAAESVGVVERKGSWYNRGETRFAQGTVFLILSQISFSIAMFAIFNSNKVIRKKNFFFMLFRCQLCSRNYTTKRWTFSLPL